MTTQLISVSGINDVLLDTTAAARNAKCVLCGDAADVVAVTCTDEAKAAANVLKDVKAFLRSVEVARTAAKAPFLAQGIKIDALAKELTTQLELHATRIGNVLGVWTAEQNRIAEEARKKAYEDEQRIRKEAEAKAREAAEQAWREQQELARKQTVARTAENAAKYAAEAIQRDCKAKEAQERRDLEAEQAIVQARISAANVAAQKPAGIATRSEVRFEVENITALYEAAPYLVTLTPNTAAIKSALKSLSAGQHLPGVRHWWESKAIVRS